MYHGSSSSEYGDLGNWGEEKIKLKTPIIISEQIDNMDSLWLSLHWCVEDGESEEETEEEPELCWISGGALD